MNAIFVQCDFVSNNNTLEDSQDSPPYGRRKCHLGRGFPCPVVGLRKVKTVCVECDGFGTVLGMNLPTESPERLTELQAAFVKAYVWNGGNATQAAVTAGYSEVSARTTGAALPALPHVARAIFRERERRIAHIASVSLDVLEGIVLDETAPPAQRAKVGMFILGLAGHAAPKRRELAEGNEKPLQSMTKAELEAFFRKRADAAKPVLQAAVNAAGEAEVTDIVDIDPT